VSTSALLTRYGTNTEANRIAAPGGSERGRGGTASGGGSTINAHGTRSTASGSSYDTTARPSDGVGGMSAGAVMGNPR
jgi:hypothetical protein